MELLPQNCLARIASSTSGDRPETRQGGIHEATTARGAPVRCRPSPGGRHWQLRCWWHRMPPSYRAPLSYSRPSPSRRWRGSSLPPRLFRRSINKGINHRSAQRCPTERPLTMPTSRPWMLRRRCSKGTEVVGSQLQGQLSLQHCGIPPRPVTGPQQRADVRGAACPGQHRSGHLVGR